MSIDAILRKYVPHWSIFDSTIKKILLVRSKRFLLPERTVLLAETDKVLKKQALSKCKNKWDAEYTKTAKEAVLKINEFGIEENQEALIEDAVFSHFAYGFSADEYFAFDLATKTYDERKSYISDLYRKRLAVYLNEYFPMEIFLDKYKTYQYYKDTYKRDVVCIFSPKDWDSFSDFYDRHPSFIKKRVDLARGNSVELIQRENEVGSKQEIFQKILNSGKCVLEEVIDQADPLAVFHPASVNTVRVITIWKDGKLDIPYCILRTGRGSAVIDNASAGGISAAIDPKTGIITTDGMDERNHIYERHPDSGVMFKGYAIPDWDKLIDFISEIVVRYTGVVYVGWDLAYCKRGWCLVEGNYSPQVEARQVLCGGMKEEFDKIIGGPLK